LYILNGVGRSIRGRRDIFSYDTNKLDGRSVDERDLEGNTKYFAIICMFGVMKLNEARLLVLVIVV
jgi:hypothetical protein